MERVGVPVAGTSNHQPPFCVEKMNKTTFKSLSIKLIVLILQLAGASQSHAKCTFIINSTNGYTVTVEVGAVGVNAPTSCTNGYNYTIDLDYNISFSGNNVPSSMYTLQGYLDCGSNTNMFFNLPNNGGIGTTTTSNTWRNASDCQSATVNTLDCNEIRLVINGPGIKNQTLTCNSPLPVELVNFEANHTNTGEVAIKWVTATEENNDFFTLYRSFDGYSWDSIQYIQGAGNSLSLKTYETTDRLSSQTDVVYYRLKQTDYNGEFTYAAVAVVKTKQDLNVLKFTPNPAQTLLTISTTKRALGSINIVNTLGQNVTNEVIVTPVSDHLAQVDLSTLPTGFYTVVTPAGTGKFQKN